MKCSKRRLIGSLSRILGAILIVILTLEMAMILSPLWGKNGLILVSLLNRKRE